MICTLIALEDDDDVGGGGSLAASPVHSFEDVYYTIGGSEITMNGAHTIVGGGGCYPLTYAVVQLPGNTPPPTGLISAVGSNGVFSI